MFDNFNMVQYLMDNGADVNAQTTALKLTRTHFLRNICYLTNLCSCDDVVLDDFTVRTHDLSYALQHAALESSELLFTSTTIFLFAWLLEKISCASMDFLDTGGKHVRLIIILTFSFQVTTS